MSKFAAVAIGSLLFTVAGQVPSADAAGVERSTQSTAILFEEGGYAELTFGHVAPKVSGTQSVNAGPGSLIGASSGDMTGDYTTFNLGVKTQLDDRFSLAVVLDQPIGADVNYPAATGYLYGGSTATLDSNAVTAMAKYTLPSNVSLIGGLRAMRTKGNVSLFNGYQLRTSTETDYGYLLGVAYEKPDIALRVSLTYISAIKHKFAITENSVPSLPLNVEIPQSVNLEFQTGIAKDTLLFGSARWVDWTAFEIAPAGYMVATGGRPLVDYNGDTTTFTLGLGRRFNENWSGAVILGYEEPVGGFSGNLGPTDGQKSIGLAVTYEQDSFEITGGLRYVDLGGTSTEAPLPFPPGTTFSSFTNNHALGVGVKVAYKF
ncbi:hypothetical protein [Oceaniovalibus sp. ACAM 378]|uniref:hypothetical protein n=1 Tax=Oceaniovalibus sp. ACAM 378 TaxID=2599923 RepID=UPI0021034FAF|nr:hypothetical protein [Oceaniovalibus sp. ACAM 378]